MRNFDENTLKNSKLIKFVFLIVSFFWLIEKNSRKLNLKANFENSKKSIEQFERDEENLRKIKKTRVKRKKFEKNEKNEKNRKKMKNINYDQLYV